MASGVKMDYGLANFAQGMDPVAAQQLKSQLLRKRAQQSQLADASQQAHQFDTLAAVTQMINNPQAAAAAEAAAKNSQSQYKPVQMGQQGFALPGTGDFVSSPMYEEERAATRNAARDNVQARLDASRETTQARLDAQKERDAQANSLRTMLAQQAEQGRNDRAAQSNALRQTLATISAGSKASGKVMPAGEVRRLSEKETIALGFNDLVGSFKDNYAGTPGLAALENTAGKYNVLGSGEKYKDQSNWWQNYNDYKNRIRHELFGSALTAPEKEAFDRANITEGMAASEISRRLKQQARASALAYNKLVDSMGQAGYDRSGFSNFPMVGAPLPGDTSPRVENAPSWLPKGAKILGVREK